MLFPTWGASQQISAAKQAAPSISCGGTGAHGAEVTASTGRQGTGVKK